MRVVNLFRNRPFALLPATSLLLVFAAASAHAQASQSTAIRKISPSAFALATGTFTGVGGNQTASVSSGGHNIALTAGVDLGVLGFGRYELSVEARGTLPIQSGTIVGEKSVLGGVRFSREPEGAMGIGGALRPYVDALIGRGEMDYQRGGYVVRTPTQTLLYTQTSSWVYGGGGGVELDLTKTISARVDAQVQHWSTPVLTAGSTTALQAGAGITYRFGGGSGPR